MVILFPISLGTIIIIGIILGSPIIHLGIKIGEVFQLISQHTTEITIGAFIIFFITAIIFCIVSKKFIFSFPIFLNGPAIAIFPAFAIAELVACFSDGVIWGLFTSSISFVINTVIWLFIIAVGIGAFLLFHTYIEKNKASSQAFEAIISFLICLVGSAIQFGILAICFF